MQQSRIAEELERFLDDPTDPENPFSFAQAVELDERDEYPQRACDLLDDWELHHYCIPREYGGKLDSYQELVILFRLVARRNLTIAVAYFKSFLGAVIVWTVGAGEQKRKLAAIMKNREQVALAYHEKAHGSDMLSNEVEAKKVSGGYLISGEKWLVNNATRGAVLTLFARTGDRGGPRGFSLFLVEKT